MSDDVKVADATQTAADAQAGKNSASKSYSEEEFKKVIEERDKAKEKARKYEEADKKAAEQKAVEEGRIKELLTQREAELDAVKKKAEAYEAQQSKLRESLIAKLPDGIDKEVGVTIPDLDKLTKFVESRTHQQAKTYDAKQKSAEGEQITFKTQKEWEDYMVSSGKGR
jgi:hypothetical protein